MLHLFCATFSNRTLRKILFNVMFTRHTKEVVKGSAFCPLKKGKLPLGYHVDAEMSQLLDVVVFLPLISIVLLQSTSAKYKWNLACTRLTF